MRVGNNEYDIEMSEDENIEEIYGTGRRESEERESDDDEGQDGGEMMPIPGMFMRLS
eukprot:NODE_5898_length_544_cov_84.268687_g5151_i0.p1 GENE.NODE_5898_length_544_cov_84.268687_g5151_i0~~NODE_5898_length_544_cov_84.268687_g5151_i0.p1  ORF type:complete len:57 (-),score=7.85 NODE_5898_length_544_cov_84.268687_g5151_i0:33-203(-)